MYRAQTEGQPALDGLRLKYLQQDRDNYYRFLYYLVLEYKPQVAIEIGVDFGIASAHLVEAAKSYGGLVVGIDILRKRYSEIRKLERGDNYIFLHASSVSMGTIDYLKTLAPIGLVYQDSSHHYLESKREWDLISPLCQPGAIWLCDDITPAFHDPLIDPPGKGMCQYFEEIPRPHKKLYQDVLHYGNCQGIVIL